MHCCGVIHCSFCKCFKSQCPGANMPCLNEQVATDTFFNDTPAMDDGVPGCSGCAMLQIFHGLTSGAMHGHPMKSDEQVEQAFEDHICKVGASIQLKGNNVKSKLCKQKDILCQCIVDDAQSKAHCQHQNQAKCKIQDIKRAMNNTMNCVGCPAWA